MFRLGLGAMLVSNEAASWAASKGPGLITSLDDLARFARNLRLQADFAAGEALARLSAAITHDLNGNLMKNFTCIFSLQPRKFYHKKFNITKSWNTKMSLRNIV